jgi:hypothetical protein
MLVPKHWLLAMGGWYPRGQSANRGIDPVSIKDVLRYR